MKYEGHLEAFYNKIYTANTEQHPSVYCDSVTMFITDTFSFNSCSRTNLSMKGSRMFAQTCTATESTWTRHSWHCIHWLWRITRSRMLALLYMPMMQTFWSKDSQNPVPVCTGGGCSVLGMGPASGWHRLVTSLLLYGTTVHSKLTHLTVHPAHVHFWENFTFCIIN